MIETIITVIASSTGGIFAKGMFDAWIASRAVVAKRDEATSAADATLKTKRIEDDAHIRAELWDRVEKLEKNQESYLRENADLRGKLAERDATIALRDAAIVQLTDDMRETRERADAAEKRAEAAEDRCEALAVELHTLRRELR